MVTNTTAPDAAASDQLHPWVYRTIVGLALSLILSVWGFFGPGYTKLALTVVSLFFVVAIAIPTILWRIWRSHAGREAASSEPESFSAWQAHDLSIDQGRLKGTEAAIQVLLPIVAVALGMAVFALVLHFDIGA